jgi:two-component system, chemotaxis family, sensor kinase CheA
MNIDFQSILDTFFAETLDILSKMEEGLSLLKNPVDIYGHLQLFDRHVHAIRGNAECLGFVTIVRRAQRAEGVLDELQSRVIPASPEVIGMLVEAVAELRSLIEQARSGGTLENDEHKALRQHIVGLSRIHGTDAAPAREERGFPAKAGHPSPSLAIRK